MIHATKRAFLAATALSASYAIPAFAQDSGSSSDTGMGNDIVVTARRTEEKLQDVPISITVLNPEQLANNNITNAKDIATYTPGLTTNNRYGSDNTTWTVRGFTQEQRTQATVGTYFNDVVAPRGSGATQGGDGAGPGNLFDLSNVQVLKGPQGTLQGRNSTGGAVLLVPKKPTDKFEGYLEGQVGNYDMYRVQGVINAPLGDTVRMRIGIDRQKRSGYLQNAGKIGFGPYGNAGGSVDTWAARASLVWDVTPDIENYTVATWSHTKSTGVIPKITQAFYRDPYTGKVGVTGNTTAASVFEPVVGTPVSGVVTSNGGIALNQLANERAVCGDNWWCVSNGTYDSRSESQTWQAINTTTWKASDSLTVKNILSYGEFRGDTVLDLFGLYNPRGGASVNGTGNIDAATGPLFVRTFAATRAPGGYGLHTNAEKSFVEELQFQHSGDRFNWQGGLYLEINNPIGKSGTGAPSQTPCGPLGSVVPVGDTAIQVDPQTLCLATGNQANSLGRVGLSTTENYFRGKALYWQGIYKLNDQFKITAGFRYTWDTMRSDFQLINFRYYTTTVNSGFNGRTLAIPGTNTTVAGLNNGVGFCNNNVKFGYPTSTAVNGVVTAATGYFAAADWQNQCLESHTVKTSAPTWLIDLDYKPSDNILLYAKWSRGYRQGGVASFGLDQVQDYDKEKVDTYEVGAKTSWRGSMPGYFNVSAYYNNFRNQQLQLGIQCNPTANCPQTTAIVNAGKSHLEGFEIEAGITPFKGFRLEASYAYLHTKIVDFVDVSSYILSKNNTLVGLDLRPLPIGSEIPNAQPHKLVLSASYTLPVDESIGKITLGATMVYSSKYRAVSDPGLLASCTNLSAVPINTNTNVIACSAKKPDEYSPEEYGVLPGNKVFNLSLNWEKVGGTNFDLGAFVTNLTNERVLLHANVQTTNTGGFLSNIIGEPRMYGMKIRWRWGD